MKSHGYENTPEEYDLKRDEVCLAEIDSTLRNALRVLESNDIKPESYARRMNGIPFGRFGDGTLETSFTDDMGYFSGEMHYISKSPSDIHDEFKVKRELYDQKWWIDDHTVATNYSILSQLDAHWPQFFIDNTRIRQCIDSDQVDMQAIFTIVEEDLAPHAKHAIIERGYATSRIFTERAIDTNGKLVDDCYSLDIAISSETTDDGFQSVSTHIAYPISYKNRSTILHIKATSDQIGNVELHVTDEYTDQDTQTDICAHITDASIPYFARQINDFIQCLIDEKLEQ